MSGGCRKWEGPCHTQEARFTGVPDSGVRMDPRFKRLGNGLMTCIAMAWFGYQALYGDGLLRIGSTVMLVICVIGTASAVLNDIRPRPKRRRSREREAG
ncbi:hypothetical protein TNCT6_63900 [Streptomyces sp. 6-11-2]|nr:hypothetical protein TNCT6_63900 [Streptomyces sp. 6-11-2]